MNPPPELGCGDLLKFPPTTPPPVNTFPGVAGLHARRQRQADNQEGPLFKGALPDIHGSYYGTWIDGDNAPTDQDLRVPCTRTRTATVAASFFFTSRYLSTVLEQKEYMLHFSNTELTRSVSACPRLDWRIAESRFCRAKNEKP